MTRAAPPGGRRRRAWFVGMPALHDALPALYRTLLGAPLDREVPAESKATCHACAMVAGCPETVAPLDGRSRLFRADTKCCTYHPRLPNDLVGALLQDPNPGLAEGRRRMEARLRSAATASWRRWRSRPRRTGCYPG